MERQIESPDIKAVLDDLKNSIFAELNCISIGRIDSFDTTIQTATIKIAYKKVINNEIYNYPLLVDCPVFVMSGSTANIQMPIKQGDYCIVLFCDRDIDNFYKGNVDTTLNSERMHNLSDGIALVGITNLLNSFTYIDADSLSLVNDTTFISLKEKIKIENSTANLKSLIDSLIDELSGTTITIPYGSSAGTFPIDNAAAIIALKSEFAKLLE